MGQLKVECRLPDGAKAYISSWTSPFVGERIMISSRADMSGRKVSIPRPYRVSSVIYEEHGPEAGSKLIAVVSVTPEKPSQKRRHS